MQRLVILLRGINVGRHKRISMADLRRLLEERGYGDVKTYLQSGNVVVSTDRDPASVAADFSPERLVVAPGVLHAWCPDGVNDSPLMKALTRVRATATARNWRTVEALADMARG